MALPALSIPEWAPPDDGEAGWASAEDTPRSPALPGSLPSSPSARKTRSRAGRVLRHASSLRDTKVRAGRAGGGSGVNNPPTHSGGLGLGSAVARPAFPWSAAGGLRASGRGCGAGMGGCTLPRTRATPALPAAARWRSAPHLPHLPTAGDPPRLACCAATTADL